MPLTGPRNTVERKPRERQFPVAQNADIHQGGLVVLDGGLAKPGRAAEGLVCVGIAVAGVRNTGADGAAVVNVRSGCFRFENDATAPVTYADVGAEVFLVDDETVASDGTGRSPAGICFDLDDLGVWVTVG